MKIKTPRNFITSTPSILIGFPPHNSHHFLVVSTSRTIVCHALQRAQVDAPHRGSHQFRHALAVRMLQGGASLNEIGEVLRHQSPQTTSIYARVDISALRSLALPWPGGVR